MLNKFSLKATVVPCLWLLSFVGSFLFLPMADGFEVAGVITLLAGLLAYGYTKTENGFTVSPLSCLIIALWAVAANSVIWSDVQNISLIYLFFFSAFPLTFFLFGLGEAKNKAMIGTNILRAVGCFILTIAVINVIQFFYVPSMLKFGGTHWPFEDNNSLAAILGVGVLIGMAEALRGGRWRYVYVAAAIIMCAAVITTGGTGLLLGLLFVVPIFYVMVKPSTYQPLYALGVGVVILLLTMTTAEINFFNIAERVPQTTHILLEKGLTEPNSMSGHRWMIWQSTIDIFKAYPWAGTGIGTFFLYYPEFRQIAEDSAGYQAHNDLLQFAAEMGWMAPILAMAMVAWVVFTTFKNLKNLSGETRLRVVTAFAVFGLLIGHSLINFNMYVLPSLMIVGLCLAIWNNEMPSQSRGLVNSPKIREALSFAIFLVVVVPLWALHLSEYYTKRAMTSLAQGDIASFATDLNRADKWAMGMNGRATLQGAKFAAATDDNHERALSLLNKAEQSNPRLVQIYIERAYLLKDQDTQTALREAEKAVRLDKTSLDARLMVADILNDMGRDDESYEVLKAGLDGKVQVSNHQPFFETLARRAVERGDAETSGRALIKLRAPRVHRPSAFE